MPQRTNIPEKRKYVLFESSVLLENTTEEGVLIQKIYPTKELVEVNENMINAFTSNPRIFDHTPVCEIKFLERYENGEIETVKWYVNCSLDQATRNIELVYKTLCEFLGEAPASEKIEL